MTLGKGRAEAIGDRDIALLADTIGCHPADLEAIAVVESNGFGWFKDGRMKILFEKHWFYKNLEGAQRTKAVKANLARAKWISPARGGYKDQSNANARYRLLARAMEIDAEAALRSISMGKFQIMGFNYALCGFMSAKHMWTLFLDSEVNQLRAFATFLKKKNLWPALRARNFATIEEIYNGGGLNGRYADRMAREADKLRAGKWSGYKPGQFATEKPASERKSSPPPGTQYDGLEVTKVPVAKRGRKTSIVAVIVVAVAGIFTWLANLPCEYLNLFCGN